MTAESFNTCSEPNKNKRSIKDPYASSCEYKPQFQSCAEGVQNYYHAPDAPYPGIDEDILNKKTGLGEPNYCDPMLTGQIIDNADQPQLPPTKSVIYRYAKGFRSIDEAAQKLFQNVQVIDDRGKVFKVPIMWGSQEKAVAAILQNNVRKDNTGVVDRITLPMMSIFTSDYEFPRERYIHHMAIDYKRGVQRFDNQGHKVGAIGGSPSMTHREQTENDTILGTTRGIPVNLGYTLTIWTAFWEDMNQILEQIGTKFNPLAYIRISGVTNWESNIRIDSIDNNLDTEPGDINKRVFKFVIHLTAESYIPQPIIRRKSVLKTKVEITDGIEESEIQTIIARIEDAVGDINV